MKSKKVTEEAYEVEEIIGYKRESENDMYHVKWIGYQETTWEPVSLLENCSNLIKEYWKKVQKKMNQSNELTKLNVPSDFRLKYNLPFLPSEGENIQRKVRTKRDLIPWPNKNDDEEPYESSFFDLQSPGFLTFIERNQNPKWENNGYLIFNEKSKLDEKSIPKYKIHKIVRKENNNCVVQIEDERGNINEMDYDLFYSFFPNSVFEYYNDNLLRLVPPI